MWKEKKSAVNNSRTRAAKAKAQEEHTAANRQVRKSVKMDKQNYIDCLVEEGEHAVGSGNIRQLCNTTRKLASKNSKPE